MEDWDAVLSPCSFATTHFPVERSIFITQKKIGASDFMQHLKSVYKAKSLACSLANRDSPVAATLQRNLQVDIFYNKYKDITKENVPRKSVAIISARMEISF